MYEHVNDCCEDDCAVCKTGERFDTSNSLHACSPCSRDTFNDKKGLFDSCDLCPDHSSTTLEGTTQLNDCQCNIGCDRTDSTISDEWFCQACGVGTYGTEEGCMDCVAGTYTDENRLKSPGPLRTLN